MEADEDINEEFKEFAWILVRYTDLHEFERC